MNKLKLFTHTDLDGVGCAVLAYLAFGRENVDVEYCDYKNVDEKVGEFLQAGLDKNYDRLFITDISIREDTVNYLLDCPDEYLLAPDVHDIKWRLFDHHATALWLNKYGWCEVLVENPYTKVKTCGTELFDNYLYNHGYLGGFDGYQTANITRFVEIIRDYDTWRWKELGEEGLVCKQVNDLFDIYGREDFIEWATDEITKPFIPRGNKIPIFPYFYDCDKTLLEQKQKDIDIYVEKKERQMKISDDYFGHLFGWVFAERYFSELGNRLCELHPEIEYVAMIDISTGKVSFRTIREDLDVGGEIAHSYGGGGHKKAAGAVFSQDVVNEFVRELFSHYEIDERKGGCN